MSATGSAEERAHWLGVLASFRGYERMLSLELSRRALAYARLPPSLAARLPPSCGAPRDSALRAAASANQLVLDALVSAAEEGVMVGDDEDAAAPPMAAHIAAAAASPAYVSKVRSTLHQLARDWSTEGAAERAACYGPVLAELVARLPASRGGGGGGGGGVPRVLVPGCGAGRLVLESCLAGYATQGCEFSLQMLFASNLMLNAVPDGGFIMYPYIHDSSNHLHAADMLRAVRVPDVSAAAAIATAGAADMSMAAGDFCAVYGAPAQRGAFDAALCVFFLDTAPRITEYLDTLRHTLRVGGLLIALGPLLYHWAAGGGPSGEDGDERFARSVELPYEDVRFAIEASGFKVLKEEFGLRQTYAGNARSLQQTVYNCILVVAERL